MDESADTTQPGELPLRLFPSRIASLGFAVRLPHDWPAHALPEEQPDFTDPSRLVPLAAVTAPHAAIVWAIAARPAYGDGSLSDWAHYLLAQHGLAPREFAEGRLGSLPALIGEAVQPSEVGPLSVRFAFAEDGGRLINLTLTAPALMADAVARTWVASIETFALEEPGGTTVPLWPPAADANAASAAHPDIATPPGDEDSGISLPTARGAAAGWAAHARADGAATLEPEHPINRRLRDAGVGLVPRILELDRERQCVTLGCGALTAQLTVPLGWHVIDDGRRVLVFEPDGTVQLHLDLLALDGGGRDTLLDRLEAQARRDYPAPECLRVQHGAIDALVLRNIQDGDQPLEQVHLLVDGPKGPDGAQVLRARVTAVPACASAAADMGELMLESVVFGSFVLPASGSDSGPDWWLAALLLERANRLHEAEQCITDAIDHPGAALQVAELYRQRMLRLDAQGQTDAAAEAREAAMRWAQHCAAGATSGGAGRALSRERDAFMASL
ncbi:hypothetical protein HLB44_06245 [Aquincola sp. S2]|uniref:Uncharacterized protein n=1 Tax=Pseudaquabacterium terrae TaxID=2732868 RepID=A0ABX2ECP0_9BURK|nr:hypothetical protein [Aquabacterium terrae]NRF66577.1 hypothetical protein [Aquabacterium terrae]